jgi:L-lactate dehydrogenase complex protein LldG
MISELHVAVLPVSRLVQTAFDFEAEFRERLKLSPNYYAFITGASRTADIERVLALGVHGPLELHILLLTDELPQ